MATLEEGSGDLRDSVEHSGRDLRQTEVAAGVLQESYRSRSCHKRTTVFWCRRAPRGLWPAQVALDLGSGGGWGKEQVLAQWAEMLPTSVARKGLLEILDSKLHL